MQSSPPASGADVLPTTCRRHWERRRVSLLPMLVHGHFHGRRRRARRGADQRGFYVDRYPPSLLALVVTIFLLNCTDALLTLRLLQTGSEEMNPLMAVLIEWNWNVFTTAKFTLTGLCLGFLVLHINFRLFRIVSVRQLLWAILGVYMALVCYELWLLGRP